MTIRYVTAEHHQLEEQARHKKQDGDIAERTYIYIYSQYLQETTATK